jgi:succinate-acetate transporter protein
MDVAKTASSKLYANLKYWPGALFVWLLLSGNWAIALAGLVAIIVSPLILEFYLFLGIYFTIHCDFLADDKPPSDDRPANNPVIGMALKLIAVFTYLWIFIALWGYYVLKYTFMSIAGGVWGAIIATAPWVLLISALSEEFDQYQRLAKWFSAGAFIAAFVSIRVFGVFNPPAIWTYGILWILWIVVSIVFLSKIMLNNEQRPYKSERKRGYERTSRNTPKTSAPEKKKEIEEDDIEIIGDFDIGEDFEEDFEEEFYMDETEEAEAIGGYRGYGANYFGVNIDWKRTAWGNARRGKKLRKSSS